MVWGHCLSENFVWCIFIWCWGFFSWCNTVSSIRFIFVFDYRISHYISERDAFFILFRLFFYEHMVTLDATMSCTPLHLTDEYHLNSQHYVFSMLVRIIHVNYHRAVSDLRMRNCDRGCNLDDIPFIYEMLILSDLQGEGNYLELLPCKWNTLLWVGWSFMFIIMCIIDTICLGKENFSKHALSTSS